MSSTLHYATVHISLVKSWTREIQMNGLKNADSILGCDLCGLVGRYQYFGGTYCLHLQGYNSTGHFNPEDEHWYHHCCEKLKSHIGLKNVV
jgi:hypothetical protein